MASSHWSRSDLAKTGSTGKVYWWRGTFPWDQLCLLGGCWRWEEAGMQRVRLVWLLTKHVGKRDGVLNSREVKWSPFGEGWVRDDLEQLGLKVVLIKGTRTPGRLFHMGVLRESRGEQKASRREPRKIHKRPHCSISPEWEEISRGLTEVKSHRDSEI